MVPIRHLCLPAAFLACAGHAIADETTAVEAVVVTAAPATETSSATGLPLTLMDTPQTVTVIGQTRIKDFAINNVNDLLEQVPGLNVEKVETDRTEYNSRGFDVTNFQIDGIGLPLISGLQTGDLDTALWDRVEIVQGSNALMTGVGNPSATINYIRKRPTPTFEVSLAETIGSWDQNRFEADVSGPLNKSGTVEGRVIFAHEGHDSYLDFNLVNRNVYGALLSWDLTPHLKATVGYSRQQNDAKGVLWGALPLSYSDGGQIEIYPRSASTSADWTYWNVRDQSAFGELAYGFANGWSVKGVFTYRSLEENAKLLYAYGYPDRETGLGVDGMSGVYPSNYDQYLLDAYASGPLRLFGREHQLAFGVSTGRSGGKEYEGFSDDTIVYPDFRTWGQVQVAEPSYPDPILQAETTDWITRLYGVAHLDLGSRLKGLVGASATWLNSTGTSYGEDQSRKNSAVSPYVGALFDVSSHVTLYGSYTDIFDPQIQVDVNNRKLAPATGTSFEAGVKSQWLGKRLYATAAFFQATQNGLATYAGTFGPDAPNGPIGESYYTGVDTTSTGFEVEVAGRITDRWTISGGYTGYTLTGPDGANPRPYLPNETFKLSSTYTFPGLRDLKVGAQFRWQNGIYYVDGGVQTPAGADAVVRQSGYAVLDLMAGIQVVDHVRATINLSNVTDEKYLASLQWGQAYYAAPTGVSFTLAYDY